MLDPLDGFINRGDVDLAPPPPPQRRPVKNPRLPADAGISVLGLTMQTAGAALMLLAMAAGIAGMIALRSPMVLVFAALCAGRSALQMRAGSQLAQFGIGAASALRMYLVGAAVQTGLLLGLLAWWLDAVPAMAFALAALLLLGWPAVIGALWTRPDFRAALAETDDPESDRLLPEDRGFTAIGLLMLVGGAVIAPALLVAIVNLASSLAVGGFAVLAMMGVAGLFMVRAGFGAHAGWVAMRSRDPHRFHATFDRYQTTANASVIVAGLYLLILTFFAGAAGLIGFVLTLPALFAMQAWPRALRQYVDRNLPEGTFSEERLPVLRRPRDAGLGGLGLLLLASGVFGVVGGLASLLLSGDALPAPMAAAFDEATPISMLGGAVALVAGWSLFQMTAIYRVAAVVYGVVAGALAVWGAIHTIGTFEEIGFTSQSQWVLLVVMQVWTALVLPLLTLWVALRHEDVGDDVADQELVTAFD